MLDTRLSTSYDRRMSLGPSLLKDWIKRRGYNQTEAAEYLGITIEEMSQFVNARRRPKLEKAVRFERLTGIPVAAWVSSAGDALTDHDPDTAAKL